MRQIAERTYSLSHQTCKTYLPHHKPLKGTSAARKSRKQKPLILPPKILLSTVESQTSTINVLALAPLYRTDPSPFPGTVAVLSVA
jgi:hypothetical protein